MGINRGHKSVEFYNDICEVYKWQICGSFLQLHKFGGFEIFD